MAGIFLSYARFDAELGERIIAGLRALDVECWWDRDMPGVDWPQEIERQIDSMSALVVVWTTASKESRYVRAEAIPAFDREKLINIMVGVHEPPLPFNLYNGFQLDGWTGREPHENWTRFIRTLEAKLVKAGEVKQGQLVGALGRREQGVRRRQATFAAAEEAFAAAKAADGEAEAAVAQAKAALTRAEEQLSQVSAIRAGPNVIRGAQADLDDANTGLKTAEAARKAAAAGLTTASRALARAKTAVESAFVSPPALATEPPSDGAEADDDAEPADEPESTPASSGAASAPASPPPAASTPAASALAAGAASAAPVGAHAASAVPSSPGPSSAGPTSAGPSSAGPASAGPSSLGGAWTSGGAGASAPKPGPPIALLVGGAAVLVAAVGALVLFTGHHPTPPSNAIAGAGGNSTNSATNFATANTAPVGPAIAPVTAQGVDPSASLSDILALVQSALIAQGSVAFEGFAHDSDPPAGKMSDWTYTKRIEYSDISLDPADCQLKFHFKLYVNGDVSDDKDAAVPLRDVSSIKVAPEVDLLQIRDAQAGHPTYSSRLQPPIYDVDVVRGDGGVNEFSFYSLDTAHRVASLFQAAAQRCGVTSVATY
jgi:TIR domain